MTKILDRLPIPDRGESVKFGATEIRIHRDQILVWLSISLSGVSEQEENIPRIPALIDPGSGFEFSIKGGHLAEWAGLVPDLLDVLGTVEINHQTVNRHAADVWIYPNQPGRREWGPGKPFRLEMDRGIAVYPRSDVPAGPRLPLLGLPGLLKNKLDFWIDADRRHVYLQTASWRTKLIRLFQRF